MYPRFAFSLLFSICAFGLGIASPSVGASCGPHAQYRSCGSACAPTCAHPEPSRFCIAVCVAGCFCEEGYLKNERGECVLAADCDTKPVTEKPKCGKHEIYKECGTACPATCADPKPEACIAQCVAGCFCEEGYLRNKRGDCVPAADCDAKTTTVRHTLHRTTPLTKTPAPFGECKENEIFAVCGSACAPTCANPRPGPVCTRRCIPGCFCKPGFLKNRRGVCVRPERCSEETPVEERCGENEEYRQCKGCDGTCDNPNPICSKICIPGCACKPLHLRSGPNGRCIAAHQCSRIDSTRPETSATVVVPQRPTCGEHEVYSDCGTACPATCARPKPEMCTANCVEGCFCEKGYLRNERGVCVLPTDCDAKTTTTKGPLHRMPLGSRCDSDREVYVSICGNMYDCINRCDAPPPYLYQGVPMIDPSSDCLKKECSGSCVCKMPYLRNSDGRCVEKKECDHATSTGTGIPTTTPR